MMRAFVLALTASAIALPLPAAAETGERPAWDVLIERGFGKDAMAFLVDSGTGYVDSIQTPDEVSASGAEGVPVPADRISNRMAYYLSAVAPTIDAGFETAFAAHMSKADMKLLAKETAGEDGQTVFSCLLSSAPAPDGGMSFDSCNAPSDENYRRAAQGFIDGFNAAILSRPMNDAFGGAACRALDEVVAAYNSETFELTINGSVGMGAGNSRECAVLKDRWSALAGYDWLIASKEFGE